MIKIDNYDFECTAKAVFAMNPSAKDRYDDWEELMSFMDLMAHMHMKGTNSFSTGGFQLTAFPIGDGDDRMVRASVSAYTALKYVETVQAMQFMMAAA